MSPSKKTFPLLNRGLASLLSPGTCWSCAAPSPDEICQGCLQGLKANTPSPCVSCALPLAARESTAHRCAACLEHPPNFERAVAPFLYEGTVPNLLHQAKFGKHVRPLELLAWLASPAFQDHLDEFQPEGIFPMPLPWRRRWKRGFNRSFLLAQDLLKHARVDLPLVGGVQRKFTEPQAQKERHERLKRLKEAFHLSSSRPFRGKKILLVDDVMTTGATADALAKVLIQGGAEAVQVFVIARVTREAPLQFQRKVA